MSNVDAIISKKFPNMSSESKNIYYVAWPCDPDSSVFTKIHTYLAEPFLTQLFAGF